MFDYVHRSMPFGGAQTLSADQTYAITAYLLYSNGLVEDDFILSKENFIDVKLPNAEGFYVDDRPTSEYPIFSVEPCMQNCLSAPAQVTKRAVDVNVTPRDEDGKPAGTLPIITLASSEGNSAAQAADMNSLQAAAAVTAVDPALVTAGEAVFKKCASCHKVGDGAKNGVGPQLNGILNAAVGRVEGFKYSKALAELGASGVIWDENSLDAFLENPKAFAKGTKMSFVGLKKPEDRKALITYLSTFDGP